MSILEIIDKKRLNKELTRDEIEYWINEMLKGNIPDYQVSSLLMAITINGMSDEETFNLTDVMLHSGDIIDLSEIEGVKVDKHSTGGVGDKVTLILAPLLADFGIKVAKMSGRGLGHTGGTIDKLEAIPGFKVELSRDEFIKQVNEIGCSVISQSGNLVPADKKLYALRDVTGTVESIPLIASSIMSKKLASGADMIFIDVKVGDGALMKNLEDAKKLAVTMANIGKSFGKKVICLLTNMTEPLGLAIGNSLEVEESIDTLKGSGPADVMELIVKIASYVLHEVEGLSLEEAEVVVLKKLTSGSAYNKLEEMVKAQGGDLTKLPKSNRVFSIKSPKEGYITKIHTLDLGNVARKIGAGRLTKEDTIHPSVGLVLTKKVGDYVKKDDELLKVYLDTLDIGVNEILSCFEIEEDRVEPEPLIYEIID